MAAEVVVALAIAPYSNPALVQVPVDDTLVLNQLVDGWLEAIRPQIWEPGHPGLAGWHAYVNAEGKLRGLPDNPVATALAVCAGWRAGNDFVVGPAVFLGSGAHGGEVNVPGRLLEVGANLGLWAPVRPKDMTWMMGANW